MSPDPIIGHMPDQISKGTRVYVINGEVRTEAQVARVTKTQIVVGDHKYRRQASKGRLVYGQWGRSSREGIEPALSRIGQWTLEGKEPNRIELADDADHRDMLSERRRLIQRLVECSEHQRIGELRDMNKQLTKWVESAEARQVRIG